MRRHIQKTGVRRFFGQDLVELQAEPLAVLDGFFAEYGPCVIEGCAITPADGGTFDVAPGLVALESTDPDSGVAAVRTMPFAGAEGVAMPLYLAAEWVVNERVYDDGKVKPIAYHLAAVASGVALSEPHLTLSATGGNRFVDAVQDPAHRFISDTERSKWNDILRQAKEYAATQADASQATAVGLAKAHTDQTAAAIRDEQAIADAAGLRSAKEYADRIVAALVDGSPELLNTLEELAAALGGDPNFATTVMTEIGKRVKTTDFNTHTTSGAHVTAGERTAWNDKAEAPKEMLLNKDLNDYLAPGIYTFDGRTVANAPLETMNCRVLSMGTALRCTQLVSLWNYDRLFFRRKDTDAWSEWREIYHSGNFSLDGCRKHKSGNLVVADSWDSLKQSGSWRIDGWRADGNHGAGLFDKPSAPPKLNSQGQGVLTVDLGGGAEIVQRVVFSNGQECHRLLYNNTWTGWVTNTSNANLKIIRGSVTAAGTNGGGNADSVGGVYGEPAVVRITHYLGTTDYSAQATAVSNAAEAHSDNVVTVWRKGTSYTDFVVTGGSNNRELCAFDYLIIPY